MRCLGLHATAAAIELLVHPDNARSEVNVGPGQPKQLALSEASEDRGREQGSVRIIGSIQEGSDVVAFEEAHLPPLGSWTLATLETSDRIRRDQCYSTVYGLVPAKAAAGQKG